MFTYRRHRLKVVADLAEIAESQPDYFPVAVQRARNERAAAVLREKVEAEVAAEGHRILSSSPSYDEATPYRLHQVTDDGGNRITRDYVEGKPGIAAHVRAWDAERFEVTYYVDDLDAAGLILRTGATSGAPRGPMTDEQKAERKTLIANNKTFHLRKSQADSANPPTKGRIPAKRWRCRPKGGQTVTGLSEFPQSCSPKLLRSRGNASAGLCRW